MNNLDDCLTPVFHEEDESSICTLKSKVDQPICFAQSQEIIGLDGFVECESFDLKKNTIYKKCDNNHCQNLCCYNHSMCCGKQDNNICCDRLVCMDCWEHSFCDCRYNECGVCSQDVLENTPNISCEYCENKFCETCSKNLLQLNECPVCNDSFDKNMHLYKIQTSS